MNIATTLIGLEEILKKESGGKVVCEGRILFNKNIKLKSALLSYNLIKYFKFEDEKEVYNNISKLSFKFEGSFRVDCNRQGKHKFSSQDIRENIGEIIYNKGNKVSLDNPENIFYVDIINNNCFLGKNPINLSKRNYRVRSSKDSLNACLAFSLLKIANYNKNKLLVDCFCGDGIILIEAGLIGGKKLYGLSQDIKNASINSKIAKVKLNLNDKTLDWLDTLFKKNSVDLVITKPMVVSKTKSLNFINKITKEFFHQSNYILKKNGKIIVLAQKIELIEKYAKEYKFKIKHELDVEVGDLVYKILSLKKAI